MKTTCFYLASPQNDSSLLTAAAAIRKLGKEQRGQQSTWHRRGFGHHEGRCDVFWKRDPQRVGYKTAHHEETPKPEGRTGAHSPQMNPRDVGAKLGRSAPQLQMKSKKKTHVAQRKLQAS